VRVVRLGDLAGASHPERELVAEPVGDEVHHAGDDQEEQRTTGTAYKASNCDKDARQQC
jgi:hypothetical protein